MERGARRSRRSGRHERALAPHAMLNGVVIWERGLMTAEAPEPWRPASSARCLAPALPSIHVVRRPTGSRPPCPGSLICARFDEGDERENEIESGNRTSRTGDTCQPDDHQGNGCRVGSDRRACSSLREAAWALHARGGPQVTQGASGAGGHAPGTGKERDGACSPRSHRPRDGGAPRRSEPRDSAHRAPRRGARTRPRSQTSPYPSR
jgi:hypothetical protein